MSDTIYRQQAIDVIRNADFHFTIKSDINFADYRETVQEIFNNVLDAQQLALEHLPSAQQPTTTWLGNYCPYRCGNCGRYVDSKERYCPNCGRKASNYD